MSDFLVKTVLGAALLGARVSAMLLFAPFLGSPVISSRVKAGLALALTLLLYPAYGHAHVEMIGTWHFALGMISEFLVGIVLGLAVALVFDGVQLAGQVASTQMGFSLVNILDPQSQAESSVLSMFHNTLALLIFLQLDVHHWLLRGMAKSFEYIPAGAFAVRWPVANELWMAAAGVWLVGIQVAAPVLIATVVVDLTFAFLAKASPQFPALFVGMSVKSLIGLLIIGSSLRYWPGLFETYFTSALRLSEHILRLGA